MAMRGPVPNVTARPKPFTTAEMANLPISMPQPAQQAQQPAPAETGILPGEEQVTTRDVLRQLSPAEQSSLQKKYETGGHSQAMSYDDWLSTNFGDMPPAERAATMKSVATSAPRVSIGKDPTLPPGRNTELAKSRVAAGKPLPEGREPSQYTPEQRRTMSRNVYNPEVPMTPFGGTFTQTASGGLMARAPNPQALETAQAIAADPNQGEYSDSHIAALAQAYGIDAVKYGDDLDLLRADTMREHQRHQESMQKLDIVPNPMGGYRYAANPQKAEQFMLEREAGMTPQRRAQFAQRVIQRHNNYITDDERAALAQAVHTDQGFTAIRELNNDLNLRRADYIMSRVNDRSQNYNMSRDLRNPNYAPGMQIRSLMAAVNENNPLAMAAIYNYYGMPGARDAMQLEMGTRDNVADYETAQLAQNPDAPAPPATQSGKIRQELQDALSMDDMTQRYTAVRNIVVQLPGNEGLTPQQIDAQVQDLIAGHFASTGQNENVVQNHLNNLRNDKPRFLKFVIDNYGYTPEQAAAYYDQFNPPTTARDMGRNAVAAAGNAVGAIGNFFGGAWDAVTGKPK